MDKQVAYLEYVNRENSFHHHRYDNEMLQYEYLAKGDSRAIEESERMIRSAETGHLSDDPLKNLLYLCICNITLVTRFAIEGGMDAEKAYNASDLYIQKYDKARSTEELYNLHREMIEYYEQLMNEEQQELTRIIKLLFRQTFLLEHKYEKRSTCITCRFLNKKRTEALDDLSPFRPQFSFF